MARQIYFTGQAPAISPRLPMTQHVPPDVSGEGKSMAALGALADAGGKLLGAYMSYQERRQNCIVEDAWSEAQNKMREWRNEYQQTHKAGDARDAQAAYNSRWAEIAGEINDKYGGELSQRNKHLLARKMELGRIYADEDGAKYQEQQFNIWGRNQEAAQLARLQEDINADPYNLARHDMAIQEAVSAWESRNPGQDSTAFALALRPAVDQDRPLHFPDILAGTQIGSIEIMIQMRQSGKSFS